MKHVYFVRHGEAEHNVKNLIGGHYDAALTEQGKEQAVDAGKNIKRRGLTINVILSSPLVRAHDTALLIAKEIGYSGADIEVLDILKERDFGEHAGRSFHEVLGMSREEFLKQPLAADDLHGVETLLELHERAEAIISMLRARSEDVILVVAHSALVRSLRKVAQGIAFDQPIDKTPNGELIKLL